MSVEIKMAQRSFSLNEFCGYLKEGKQSWWGGTVRVECNKITNLRKCNVVRKFKVVAPGLH